MRTTLIICLLCLLALAPAWAAPSRLKDIAVFNGLGNHKLLGYGLIAGLEGTGDSDTSALTGRSIANMLETFGVTVNPADFKAKNMAAVMVTAEMPAVVAVGTTFDVTLSSLADAKSLQGGMLLLTPLRAADGEVYAIAQGAVTIGGFMVQTRGGDVAQKNHVNVGRVPNGASVVKALQSDLRAQSILTLSLLQPDFTTAWRTAEVINGATGPDTAAAVDNSTIRITIPEAAKANPLPFMVMIENLPIDPDTAARVVINERTGTVVIGQQVRIMPVAICHGGLTVEVRARKEVSQPPGAVIVGAGVSRGGATVAAGGKPAASAGATTGTSRQTTSQGKGAPPVRDVTPGRVPAKGGAAGGQTAVVTQEDLTVREEGGRLVEVSEQATLHDLVTALNALGVKPRDLIAIIQALKEAHALRADLVLF